MNEQEINEKYQKIIHLLKQKRIKEALSLLQTLLGEKGDWDLHNRLEKVQTSYNYLLEYLRKGSEDPARKQLFAKILTETWEMADQTRLTLLDEVSKTYYHTLHKKRKHLSAGYHLYDWLRILESHEDDLSICKLMPNNEENLKATLKRHEGTNELLFINTWCNSRWTHEEILDAQQFIASENISSNDRSLFISAITLSLQECFDYAKFCWLLTAVTLHNDNQSVQRALVGIALTLIRHSDRLELYPDLQERFLLLDEKYQLGQKLNIIYLQLLRAQETEKVNKQINEELMPEMMKSISKMKGSKLDLDNLPEDEDFNPDWEKFMEDSHMEESLMKISELQMEGMDVNMSTFAQLKQFPFFYEICNWFLPFDPNHSSVIHIMQGLLTQPDTVQQFLATTEMICNSDRYSICFFMNKISNISHTQLKDQLLNSALMQGINEDEINQIKKHQDKPNVISNFYIQDVYRFYKIYHLKNEFTNPFEQAIELHRIPMLKPILCKPELLQEVADYRNKKGYPFEALDIYLLLIELKTTDAGIFQKTGYCYQKLKRYTEAIEAYRKADILKPDQLWTIRHLATCYRLNGQYEKALEYYQKVAELEPQNKNATFYIGSCLTELNRPEEALNLFFKLDFMEENNVKAWRGIAWCSFICNKLEQAQKYYQKIISQQPNDNDFLNAGHVAWKAGNLDQAVTYYSQAMVRYGGKKHFLECFNKDRELLVSLGIDAEEIPMVLDMI